LKNNEEFSGKRYEALLLLIVHKSFTKLTKGIDEEKTFNQVREKIIKIDYEIKELNK